MDETLPVFKKKCHINLIDQEIHNLYSYETDTTRIGQKKFEIDNETGIK